jgi:hypothetical protein
MSFSLFTIYLTWQRTLGGGGREKVFLLFSPSNNTKESCPLHQPAFLPPDATLCSLFCRRKAKSPGKPVFPSAFSVTQASAFSVPGTDQKVLTLQRGANGNKQVGAQINDKNLCSAFNRF